MLPLYEWLRDTALEALENVPPGPEAIADSFGPRSPSYQRDIAALYRQNADLETVRVKRGLWRDLLRTALGGNRPQLLSCIQDSSKNRATLARI